MIIKFETYCSTNESKFFKKKMDDNIKELMQRIKDNFDINNLKSHVDGIYRYDNKIKVSKYDFVMSDYDLEINDHEINDVSQYITKDLWLFFDKEWKKKKSSDIMNTINKIGPSKPKEIEIVEEPNKKFSLPKLDKFKKFLD